MEIDEETRAYIRTLGLSRFRFWIIKTFGKKVKTSERDGWHLTHIEFQGKRYVWVR